MGKVRFLIVALLLLALGPAPALHAAESASSYDALLARLKTGDTTIDFQTFRFARAELPGFDPYAGLSDTAKGELFQAMMQSDIARVETLANDVLARDYTDIDAHLALQTVYTRRRLADRADFERSVADGLIGSIRDSGDGNTPDTAFVVISIAEEYSFLGLANVRVQRQALVQGANGPVDAMDVVTQNGRTVTVYFNVSRLFAAMSRLTGAGKSP